MLTAAAAATDSEGFSPKRSNRAAVPPGQTGSEATGPTASESEPSAAHHHPAAAIAPESRIHDVVQHRPKRVIDPDEHEVLIVRRQLPLLKQNLLLRRAGRRQ